MGLRKLICLLPTDETPDHDGWTEEQISEEQPGTSYSNNHDAHTYREYHRKMKTEKVNCSNGTSHLFACFRAGAINLVSDPFTLTVSLVALLKTSKVTMEFMKSSILRMRDSFFSLAS